MDKKTTRWKNGRMDECTNGLKDNQTDKWANEQTVQKTRAIQNDFAKVPWTLPSIKAARFDFRNKPNQQKH